MLIEGSQLEGFNLWRITLNKAIIDKLLGICSKFERSFLPNKRRGPKLVQKLNYKLFLAFSDYFLSHLVLDGEPVLDDERNGMPLKPILMKSGWTLKIISVNCRISDARILKLEKRGIIVISTKKITRWSELLKISNFKHDYFIFIMRTHRKVLLTLSSMNFNNLLDHKIFPVVKKTSNKFFFRKNSKKFSQTKNLLKNFPTSESFWKHFFWIIRLIFTRSNFWHFYLIISDDKLWLKFKYLISKSHFTWWHFHCKRV